jgi:hypothetical protein
MTWGTPTEPDPEETPQVPDPEETPQAPDPEETPQAPDPEETPQVFGPNWTRETAWQMFEPPRIEKKINSARRLFEAARRESVSLTGRRGPEFNSIEPIPAITFDSPKTLGDLHNTIMLDMDRIPDGPEWDQAFFKNVEDHKLVVWSDVSVISETFCKWLLKEIASAARKRGRIGSVITDAKAAHEPMIKGPYDEPLDSEMSLHATEPVEASSGELNTSQTHQPKSLKERSGGRPPTLRNKAIAALREMFPNRVPRGDPNWTQEAIAAAVAKKIGSVSLDTVKRAINFRELREIKDEEL